MARAGVRLRGERPVRARTAEESTIHAIRQLLERDATERDPGEHGRVEVRLISIREDGDRSVVRFTRRERYRDALGRLVERETLPMETIVVKTGVRFATPPA